MNKFRGLNRPTRGLRLRRRQQVRAQTRYHAAAGRAPPGPRAAAAALRAPRAARPTRAAPRRAAAVRLGPEPQRLVLVGLPAAAAAVQDPEDEARVPELLGEPPVHRQEVGRVARAVHGEDRPLRPGVGVVTRRPPLRLPDRRRDGRRGGRHGERGDRRRPEPLARPQEPDRERPPVACVAAVEDLEVGQSALQAGRPASPPARGRHEYHLGYPPRGASEVIEQVPVRADGHVDRAHPEPVPPVPRVLPREPPHVRRRLPARPALGVAEEEDPDPAEPPQDTRREGLVQDRHVGVAPEHLLDLHLDVLHVHLMAPPRHLLPHRLQVLLLVLLHLFPVLPVGVVVLPRRRVGDAIERLP
mmetsp:Transcript_20379/g.45184  ORF Transcript_20379/g.45184 Transcript_20379/m.45184 type:complete len:358 (+) Transcript_20379:161-1234(+)